MESLFLIIPGALLFAFLAVLIYLWTVNSGQYDDMDKTASSILFDDDKPSPTASEKKPDADDSDA